MAARCPLRTDRDVGYARRELPSQNVADNMLGDPACFDIREAQRPADISDFRRD